MTVSFLQQNSAWRPVPVADALEVLGRWLVIAAVFAAMVTPRWAFGSIRFGLTDVLFVCGAGFWGLSWVAAGSRSAAVSAAKWPALVLLAGVVSIVVTSDPWGTAKGIVELLGLWVLPAIAIVGLFKSDLLRRHVLSAASLGTLSAAAINIVTALQMGLGGSLPQVWGAADGFQGYFQTLGITVALPRLASAVSANRLNGIVGWSSALVMHVAALLLTQTRGAWIAAVFVAAVLTVAHGRLLFAVTAVAFVGTFIAVGLSADWATLIRERVESVFRFEAGLSGVDSSIIRVALALTSLQMFVAHPLTGIGLKSFPLALPYYATDALPLAVAMGSGQVLTTIEGPHSTYLSLLAETGILGFVAFVGWVSSAWIAAYRSYRAQRSKEWSMSAQVSFTLLGGISAIVVFNLFGEMNASGATPLIVWLSLAHRLNRCRSSAAPAANV